MSNQFGNDEDVVRKKARQDKLKDVEAPLRDQIVKKLFNTVEDLELPRKVDDMWHQANADRSRRLSDLINYMTEYDQFLEATIEGPFTVAGDLHLPTTYVALKTVHARFMQALVTSMDNFTAKARSRGNSEREQGISDVMKYYLSDASNNNEGYTAELDKWVWAWIGYGQAFFKQRWEKRYRKFIDVEERAVPGAPDITIDDQGNEVLTPRIELKEVEVDQVVKIFDGPVGEYIAEEDIVMIGTDNPQTAEGVIHRQWLTADQLWQLTDQKIFDEAAVKAVIKGGKSSLSGDQDTQRRQISKQIGGESELDKDFIADRYEIYEAYLSYDVDGSGINSEIIVWVAKDSRRLLRATYLDRVNKQGKRPITRIVYQPREDSNHPLGLIEMLHPLSKEVDFFHNLRVDFGFISSVPFFFYRATSNIEAEKLKIEPGMGIPVDDPQRDVFFPTIGNRTSFGQAEEQGIKSEIERLTSISDLNLGVLTGAQGATRTATGTRALLGETSANLDVFLRRLNMGWGSLLTYLFGMVQERIPSGLSFRLLGEDGMDVFREIPTRDEISGEFDFIVDPSSSSSNKQVQLANAGQIMQITSDPLAIQLGIVTPTEYYEARKNFLKQLGVKDFGKYVRKPTLKPKLTPRDEIDMVLAGQQVDIFPDMDHLGYIQLWEFIKSDDQLLGQFNEQQVIAAEQQSQGHQEMQDALQAQQNQQMNIQQQQLNKPENQPPPGAGQVNGEPEGQPPTPTGATGGQ